jgi:apolipoprotein N-acyltransferase
MYSRRALYCRLLGAFGGVLLMAGNIHGPMALFGLAGFIPILSLAVSKNARFGDIALVGLYMGLGYTLPQMFVLRLPLLISLILIVYLVLLVIAMAWGAGLLIRGSAVWGGIGVGAYLAMIDWAGITIMPMWGTAQSLGRSFSAYPRLIGFVSVTGIIGVIFASGALQGLVVNYIHRPAERRKILFAAGIVLGVFGTLDVAVMMERKGGGTKVAAMGWVWNDVDLESDEGFEEFYAGPVARAAAKGARLVVSPELGFTPTKQEKAKLIERLCEVARRNNVFLFVGYWDVVENENRCVFITDEGKLAGEYVKTHLTPFENFTKGSGEPVVVEIRGVRVGAMICQDDNFTDISRRYGRAGVDIMCVPTLDWRTVKDAHLQSSIHRGIESRYAIVRAASNGISAIISAKGKMLARKDHFAEGPGVIVAEVETYDKEMTLFAASGYWLVGVCFVFVSTLVVTRLRHKQSPKPDKTKTNNNYQEESQPACG